MKATKSKDDIRQAKADGKNDTATNNYRNRLLAAFGNKIMKKDGTLPSAIKELVSLTLRTWTKLRYGEDAVQTTRDRTVTVGVQKVLLDEFNIPEITLNREVMQSKFIELSDYVARVKVMASMFANFYSLEQIDKGEEFPKANAKFYSACLMAASARKGGDKAIHQSFQRFCTLTNNQTMPKGKGVSTLFERQVSYRPLCLIIMEIRKLICHCYLMFDLNRQH